MFQAALICVATNMDQITVCIMKEVTGWRVDFNQAF